MASPGNRDDMELALLSDEEEDDEDLGQVAKGKGDPTGARSRSHALLPKTLGELDARAAACLRVLQALPPEERLRRKASKEQRRDGSDPSASSDALQALSLGGDHEGTIILRQPVSRKVPYVRMHGVLRDGVLRLYKSAQEARAVLELPITYVNVRNNTLVDANGELTALGMRLLGSGRREDDTRSPSKRRGSGLSSSIGNKLRGRRRLDSGSSSAGPSSIGKTPPSHESGTALSSSSFDEESATLPFSRHILRIYSPSRVEDIGFVDDEDMAQWETATLKVLRTRFSREELTEKRERSREFSTFVREQRRHERAYRDEVKHVLASSGLLAHEVPRKLYEGYVKLLLDDADRNWLPCYCVLTKHCMSYFRIEDKSSPEGVIPLRFMCDITLSSSSHHRRFSITTPGQTYLWRARHEVSANEWVNSLHKARLAADRKNRDQDREQDITPLESVTETEKLDGDVILDGHPVLLYTTPGGRKKTFKINKDVTTVGRSSTNHLRLEDSKVSRVHVKIERKCNQPVILLDLGSSRGTKVNGTKMHKKALEIGDEIQIGRTVLVFDVKRKRRGSFFSSKQKEAETLL